VVAKALSPCDPVRSMKKTGFPYTVEKYSAFEYLRIALFVAVTVFAPSIGLMLASEPLGLYEHVGWGLRLLWTIPAAAVTTCAYGLIARFMLSEKTRAMGVMYAIIYGPVCAFLWVGYLNVRLDRSPGEPHDLTVVAWQHRSKGPDHLELRSWKDDSTVSVDAGLAPVRLWKPGAQLHAVVHRGALGLTFIRIVP